MLCTKFVDETMLFLQRELLLLDQNRDVSSGHHWLGRGGSRFGGIKKIVPFGVKPNQNCYSVRSSPCELHALTLVPCGMFSLTPKSDLLDCPFNLGLSLPLPLSLTLPLDASVLGNTPFTPSHSFNQTRSQNPEARVREKQSKTWCDLNCCGLPSLAPLVRWWNLNLKGVVRVAFVSSGFPFSSITYD
ncbi:hypothetical protein E2542_SST06409 [Spatholobus suberectus]|nr:hypothetical protein E2542_SST06409 [Spatholobus suberectus]